MPYLEPDPRTQPDDPSVMDALHRAYRMWQSEGNEQLAVGIIREAFAEAHAAAPPSPEPTGAGTPTLGFVLLDKMGGCYRSHVYHRRDDAEKAL
ncbi:MAG TPA: hypothetical protein VFS33_10565, partial [Gemmatimonadales bacterium]|nr:hypothetical protein [Gemmatimonadales bacterium]